MDIVRVPQINANEDEVEVVEVSVQEGVFVEQGDLLCTLESTKATMELEAPVTGYVRRIDAEAGQRVRVGELLCVLTEEADTPVELEKAKSPGSTTGDGRVTRRAQALIEKYDLDVSEIANGGILTERDVLSVLGKDRDDLRAPDDRPGASPVRIKNTRGAAIVIYGAGGHARVVIDMIREGRRDLHLVGIIDDAENGPSEVLGVPVLGDASRLPELREKGIELAALGVGAVTHNSLRAELFTRLERQGFYLPNLIHPDAVVERSVQMGQGNQIFAGAVVSSSVELGDNTIINSNTVVSHDCKIGDHVHLTPGALLAGGVKVGPRTVIGMGVTVYLGVDIGADVVISNGNHILQNVEDDHIQRT